jgi:hypothetical protein
MDWLLDKYYKTKLCLWGKMYKFYQPKSNFVKFINAYNYVRFETAKAFFTSEHSFVSNCIEVLIRSARWNLNVVFQNGRHIISYLYLVILLCLFASKSRQ